MTKDGGSSDFRETLYTVDSEGNRRWVYSDLVKGAWLYRRAIVAYFLMALYLAMPWVTIAGKQGVLLDIPGRRFIFFGHEFWATDTYFLFLLFGIMAFSLFFFTALLGRTWCGWACPETVFLEFLFRPIERLIEGSGSRRRRLDEAPWTFSKIKKKALKHVISAFFAWVIASSALAYFMGREPLLAMMSDWPHHNPVPFLLTVVMMGLMAFQFGWFREQFCTLLCPYARFQSVLMDAESLVVGYDVTRGEPRGKIERKDSGESKGDCVDCRLCVRVCPTGIDIRNGLQLECVACTSCIDACDSIMDKVGRPKGLIRYDTENRLLGRSANRTLLRPRPFVYGAILTVFLGAFAYLISIHQSAEFQVLRNATIQTYQLLDDGRISNQLQIRVSNKSDLIERFTISLKDTNSIELIVPENPFPVAAHAMRTTPVFINFKSTLLQDGKLPIEFQIEGDKGFTGRQQFTLLGPS